MDYARSCCDLFRGAVTEFCFFIFVFAVVFRIFRHVNVGDVVSFYGGGCVMMHSGAGHLQRVPRVLLWYATGQVLSRLAVVVCWFL